MASRFQWLCVFMCNVIWYTLAVTKVKYIWIALLCLQHMHLLRGINKMFLLTVTKIPKRFGFYLTSSSGTLRYKKKLLSPGNDETYVYQPPTELYFPRKMQQIFWHSSGNNCRKKFDSCLSFTCFLILSFTDKHHKATIYWEHTQTHMWTYVARNWINRTKWTNETHWVSIGK